MIAAGTTAAQLGYYTKITGVVSDPSGAAIANATSLAAVGPLHAQADAASGGTHDDVDHVEQRQRQGMHGSRMPMPGQDA